MTEEKWEPTDHQVNGVISSSWDFIRDEAKELQEELKCPSSYIAGMLRAIADGFDD